LVNDNSVCPGSYKLTFPAVSESGRSRVSLSSDF